jgi:ferredoxin-thioredoxin reductase catalytic subunit
MDGRKKTISQTATFAAMVAKKQGWKLNPDGEFVSMLMEGLTVNYNRYGYYSCPCRDADGVRERDRDIVCPCDYCRPDQEEYGHCYCGLYLTKEFFSSGKKPAPIPERRPA